MATNLSGHHPNHGNEMVAAFQSHSIPSTIHRVCHAPSASATPFSLSRSTCTRKSPPTP